MKQRGALVVMGAWLMGSICMSIVATENFYTIDRLLAGSTNTAFAAMVQKLGQPAARDLLRYLSSELNRLYFQMWNAAQLALGMAALWLIAGSTKHDPAYTPGEQDQAYTSVRTRAGPFRLRSLGRLASFGETRRSAGGAKAVGPAGKGVAAMLAIVGLMLAYLTPAIVSLGRDLDFVPRDPAPPGIQRFWILHAAYTSLEMLKLAIGLVVAAQIARRSRQLARASQ